MRFHSQNLTDGVLPLWRHGRAWWGKWRCEWDVLRHPRMAIGFEKGGYDDDRIMVHLSLLLFTVYLSREFRRCFRQRELSACWHEGTVMLHLWTSDDDWIRDRPWHRNTVFLHVSDWFWGKQRFERTQGEPVTCVVPMPEGAYPAVATPVRCVWRWRFGWTKVREDVDLRIEGGIPFEGKGENSWDCGPDGLWGIGGDTLEKAIGNAVTSVLERRRRYGETNETRGRIIYARPAESAGASS